MIKAKSIAANDDEAMRIPVDEYRSRGWLSRRQLEDRSGSNVVHKAGHVDDAAHVPTPLECRAIRYHTRRFGHTIKHTARVAALDPAAARSQSTDGEVRHFVRCEMVEDAKTAVPVSQDSAQHHKTVAVHDQRPELHHNVLDTEKQHRAHGQRDGSPKVFEQSQVLQRSRDRRASRTSSGAAAHSRSDDRRELKRRRHDVDAARDPNSSNHQHRDKQL